MQFSEYIQHDATALAQLVRAGEVSAAELLQCAQQQSARVNSKTNAVCRNMHVQAHTQLQALPLNAPFAGVPFLLKDGSQHYAGVPTSYGSRSMIGFTPAEHSHVVRRYLESGLVVFGKTNLPEFALKSVTDSQLWGPTSNPWDLSRTAGGSSGGAAAAVASGVVPMAAATDGGGSIRIPASYCGLFGLRPSRGRVSSGPELGEVWSGASSHGVISRSVRDTATALDALQGAMPGDPFQIPPPLIPYAQAMRQEPGKLRIGYTMQSPIGTPVDPQAVAAVSHAVVVLRSLGHDVEESAPHVDGQALAMSYLHMYFGHMHLATQEARRAGASRRDFELLTRILAILGETTSSGVFVRECNAWNTYARALGKFHSQWDLLLTPTVAKPAPLHGAGDLPALQQWALTLLERSGLFALLARAGLLDSVIAQIARDSLAFVPFTQLSNLTGTPSMSVPLHSTPQGLPMGVQFVAGFGQEDLLFKLANQLEMTQPWSMKLPKWIFAAT